MPASPSVLPSGVNISRSKVRRTGSSAPRKEIPAAKPTPITKSTSCPGKVYFSSGLTESTAQKTRFTGRKSPCLPVGEKTSRAPEMVSSRALSNIAEYVLDIESENDEFQSSQLSTLPVTFTGAMSGRAFSGEAAFPAAIAGLAASSERLTGGDGGGGGSVARPPLMVSGRVRSWAGSFNPLEGRVPWGQRMMRGIRDARSSRTHPVTMNCR